MSAPFPIPDAALDDRLGWIGTSGAGKTYNALTAFLRVLDRGGRGIWVDPLGVAWGMRLMVDGKTASPYPIVIFGGPHGDLPINEHAGKLIGETVAGMKESAIVDLSGFATKAAERRFMLAFLEALYRKAGGEPFHLVLDEADLWAPQKSSEPQLQALTEQIVRRGRVKGFIPWLITQRPAVLSKDVLSQVDGLVALKLTSSQDRDAIGAWIEGQADKGEWTRIRATLPTLQRGHGVVWIPGRQILETIVFPPKPTFDSSASPTRGKGGTATASLKPLDVGRLRERLATVEEEQKANDPKALKAQIAELQRQLSGKGGQVDQAAVEAAERRGYERGHAVGRHEALEAMIAREGEMVDAVIARSNDLISAVGGLRSLPLPLPDTTRKLVVVERASRTAPSPRAKPATLLPEAPDARLTGPQAQLLKALAWWREMGHERPTRTQVAAIAGWKPKGSNLRNRLSELSSRELVFYPAEGRVSLTLAGIQAAPTPDMSVTLVDSIRAVLTGPQLILFDALRASLSHRTSRAELAERVGWEPAGSNLRNRLSELSALELVEYPGRGEVALQAWTIETSVVS